MFRTPFTGLRILAALLAFLFAPAALLAGPPQRNEPHGTVPGDRWMEIDLYWFDTDHLARSVDDFWDRFEPLYQGIEGYKGVILNIGWTVGPIMEWSGNLDQKISLPHGTGQQPWVDQTSPLAGNTEQRMQEWKKRFEKPTIVQRQGYGPWTYGDVKTLASLLKQGAEKRHIRGFKVGSLAYAWKDAYYETADWYKRHPEALAHPHIDSGDYLDPGARLHADPIHLGGMPEGIVEGTPVHTAFAAQWGSLSRAVGLDALMLRDSFGLPVAYQRQGPDGTVMDSPEHIQAWTDNVSTLVRETKQANPQALLMMYSNGASAVSDWRSNGLDLERIAKEGYLDIFVDQTWAGAWNEVGVRPNDFWNWPTLGWTYQLAYTLLHGAILAGSNVRHYPLIETFDAWESWDTLHTVPERLRWSIWAYSHAAVKTPDGIVMPQGSYISWANQGKRLLSDADVQFLQTNINAAVNDAAQVKQVYGPTLVYSRSAMQWQASHALASTDVNEWMDEQSAGLMKWQVPILSATRLEWLPRIASDLPIIQTPSHIQKSELDSLLQLIDTGKPLSIWGGFDGGIDPAIWSHAGLGRHQSGVSAVGLHTAKTGEISGLRTKNILPSFTLFEKYSKLSGNPDRPSPHGVVYSTNGSPELILQQDAHKHLMLWDPPDALDAHRDIPIRQTWGGSAAPYVLSAAAINTLAVQTNALHTDTVDLDQSGTVSAWQTKDGTIHILAGNLEEGLRDDADQSRHFTLILPPDWRPRAWRSVWSERTVKPESGGAFTINLPAAGSSLYETQAH